MLHDHWAITPMRNSADNAGLALRFVEQAAGGCALHTMDVGPAATRSQVMGTLEGLQRDAFVPLLVAVTPNSLHDKHAAINCNLPNM